MLNIDGLVTGLDTTSIIEGLLSVQQSRIDRFNVRRQDVVDEQSAFKSIEANLIGLQSALGRLVRTTGSIFESNTVATNDEEAILASASTDASPGVYGFRVLQLSQAHQVASGGFASASDEITTGTLQIRVGNRQLTTIAIDETNNSLQGLVDEINSQSEDVTAAVINDGSGGDTAFRILLRSNDTGEANAISITNGLGESAGDAVKPEFDLANPVQAAADAQIRIGSGAGAIDASSSNNQIDDVIPGISLDVLRADAEKEVTITVSRDTQGVKDAIGDFVDAYNGVIEFVNEQSRFDSTTGTGGVLLGSSSATSVVRKIRDAISEAVVGIRSDEGLNVLSAIGVSSDANGKLVIDSQQLDDVLEGRAGDFTLKDVQRLFALDGQSSNPGIQFVLGNHRTRASEVDGNNQPIPFEINITRAAERASLLADNSLAASTVIDETNSRFDLTLDNVDLTVDLPHGSYTQQQLATTLEDLINNASNIQGRRVQIGLDGGRLQITSASYGSASLIKILEATDEEGTPLANANATLGLAATQIGQPKIGQDVAGEFLFFDETKDPPQTVEQAEGLGRILRGNADNENTADLSIRVELNASQIDDPVDGTMSITRGLASRLDQAIRSLLDPELGELANLDERFNRQLESFDSSIERLSEQFESQQASILREFTALESAVAQLQSTGSALSSALLTL